MKRLCSRTIDGETMTRPVSGSPFPSPAQETLLMACLLHGEPAIAAFQRWKAMVNFEQDVDAGTFRLLPLLYHNLLAHQVDDELMPRLKGIYRQSWMANQLLFIRVGTILRFFEKHGIETIVMKGIPLSFLTYRNVAVRPMADIDMLIPFSRAASAIELLSREGWTLHEPEYLEHSLKYGRSATFSDSKNTNLDLHWHPVFEAHDTIPDDYFWEFAVNLTVADVKTRAFCATDQLFHAIVHGLRYNTVPPIRWVADAIKLISDHENRIDWSRLMVQADKFKVLLQTREALVYLAENFKADVPAEILYQLSEARPTIINRMVYRHAITIGDRRPDTMKEKVYSIYAGFMRQTGETGFWRQHLAFARYLRFRTRGKPYFSILVNYFSLVFRSTKRP